MSELSEDKRRTIISSRTEALKVAPELDEADRRVQEKVLPKLSQKTRDAFMTTWQQVQGS